MINNGARASNDAIVPDVITPRGEWRGLDPETRRAVKRNARQLRPHPDPRVAAVAEGHARNALGRARRRTRWMVAIIAGLAAGVGASIGFWSPGVSTGVVMVVTMVAVMAIILVPILRVSLLAKMEMANKMALAPAGAPAPAPASQESIPEPGEQAPAGQDLAVRYNRGRVVRQLGLLFGLGCLFLAYGLLTPTTDTTERWLLVFFSALLIALAVIGAVRVLRWGLRRPILTLDAAGVHMPRYRYTLPWPELAEVRLIPMQASRRARRQPTTIIAFVPADPQAALRALRANGAGRRFGKSCQLYGTPLTLADRLMDQPASQIAAAASAFAPVPVSRY